MSTTSADRTLADGGDEGDHADDDAQMTAQSDQARVTAQSDQAQVTAQSDEGARATVASAASNLPRHDLPVLEAFRGIAALMVVFTHVGFISGVGVAGAWAGWLSRLDFGVTLFFLLSGFLLFRPFVQAAYGRRPPVRTGSYLRRRIIRIYPAFVVALFFDYLITPAARQADGSLWLQTLLLVQNYTVNFLNQLPGLVQCWSLAIEMSFYLALPLLARLALGRRTAAATAMERRRDVDPPTVAATPAEARKAALAELARRRQPWLKRTFGGLAWRVEIAALRPGILLLALALFSIGWRLYYLIRHGGLVTEILWLPSFLDWFAAGMALAWLRERDAPVPDLLRYMASVPGACWSLALAGYWLTSTRLGGPFGLEGPSVAEATLKHLTFLVIATLLLLPAVFGDPSAGWRRVAGNRFFGWLGQVSFGIFLWHPMLLAAIRSALGMAPFGGGFWVCLVLTLASSAAVATLSWRYVEEPFQRRYRNGFRRPRAVATG